MEWLMIIMIVLVVVAGAIGGAVNAMLSDNGFIFPKAETTVTGATVMRPGFLGNILTGSVAAVVSWGLYGPLSNQMIVGSSVTTTGSPLTGTGLTLASLVGAVIVGVGGARWLTSEVDKSLLKAAAVEAAARQSSDTISVRMAMSTPAETLDIARSMEAGNTHV